MIIKQYLIDSEKIWKPELDLEENSSKNLILYFGSREQVLDKKNIDTLKNKFPNSFITGCTTSGEILQDYVYDSTASVSIIEFEKTEFQPIKVSLKESKDSYDVGKKIADSLSKENLVHVLVLSDGLNINGSELTKGLRENLSSKISITGGLSGDSSLFEKTFVICDGIPEEGIVVGIGLYSTQLKVGYASMGGWDIFGPERKITKSKANILFELDGEPVLELYKKYLGEHAKDLPSSALLFPLSLKLENSNDRVVRTILGMNEKEGSLTFAGDMPEGSYTQLMKANFDRLIDGAGVAAQSTSLKSGDKNPEFALLISCVGRKLVLGQRIEEEIEAARNVYGNSTFFSGFYSYGEISPFTPEARCELHNQTMTITTLTEV
jgi:hypothetical protein